MKNLITTLVVAFGSLTAHADTSTLSSESINKGKRRKGLECPFLHISEMKN